MTYRISTSPSLTMTLSMRSSDSDSAQRMFEKSGLTLGSMKSVSSVKLVGMPSKRLQRTRAPGVLGPA